MKKQVQEEILSLLDGSIEFEISAMESHYTVAEVAQEVLLQNKSDSAPKLLSALKDALDFAEEWMPDSLPEDETLALRERIDKLQAVVNKMESTP